MRKQAILIAGLSLLMIVSLPICAETPADKTSLDRGYSALATPRYSHIRSFHADCEVKNSVAEIYVYVRPYNSNHKTSISATLQKQNGSKWQDVKTWTVKDNDIDGTSLEKSYAVLSGNYRVKAIAKIFDGTNTLETATIYG